MRRYDQRWVWAVLFGLASLWLSRDTVAGETKASTAAPSAVRMTVREVKPRGSGAFVVILETDGKNKVLPIVIGESEGLAIHMRLTGSRAPRPLTHDLLETTLAVLGAKVQRVEIDDFRDNVFLGKLTLQDAKGKKLRIDGRPSDFIALALGAKLPIWVAAHVLRQAGIDAPRPPTWTAPPAGTPTSF
jgi:hypothetical protein